jgi:hypothetical protein
MENLILRRNSEIQDYKECRQKWYWSYVKGWTPRKKKVALELGTLVHAGLEHYYPAGRKRGPHPARTVKVLYDEYLRQGGEELKLKVDDDKSNVMMIDLAVEMLQNYVKEYGKDDWVDVLAPEQQYQVDVHDPDTGDYLFTAVGTVDLCFRDLRSNRVGFMEHKTGATLEPFSAPEELDEQSGTYWVFGPQWLKHIGALPEDEELDFIMFNRLRKQFGDKRPMNEQGQRLNQNGSVSKNQPAPLFKRSYVYRNEHDRMILEKRIISCDKEMKMVVDDELDVYKHPGRHCGFCGFREMCEVHETGGDWKSMVKALYIRKDPYAEHKAS